MARVLVADSEPRLLRVLGNDLSALGYEVVMASGAAAALETVARLLPDLVILGAGLPEKDGGELIAALRGWTTVPILVLSVRSNAADIIDALDSGADDYLAEPFPMEVLTAKLRALLRRAEATAAADDPAVNIGHFTVDFATKTVVRRPSAPSDALEPVHLTKTEWTLLEVLIKTPGRLVPSHHLISQVWGASHTPKTDHLRFHMSRLRHKLEPDPSHPLHLLNDPGAGYRFQP